MLERSVFIDHWSLYLFAGHKISKEGSSSVQMQLVLNDGSTYNFHFTGEDPKKERGRVSEMLVQCISKSNAAQVLPCVSRYQTPPMKAGSGNVSEITIKNLVAEINI